MSQMQNKLEQVYKEYLDFKNYVETNKKSKDELREEVSQKRIGNEENQIDILFDIYGAKQLELVDLNQLKTRLKHFYDAYKDLIEIPVEIAEEVKSTDIKYLFSIKNGEKEIADKELYESYKQQFKEANTQLTPKE